MKQTHKRVLHALGLALTIAAAGYAIYLVSKDTARLKEDFASPRFIAFIAMGAVAYGMLGLLLSSAWHVLLSAFGRPRTPFGITYKIYGTSQILKYIPTNVLHVVRRYVETRALGTGHLALIWASFLEGLLTVCTAVGLTVLFAAPLLSHLSQVVSTNQILIYGISLGFLVGIALLIIISRKIHKDFNSIGLKLLIAIVLALLIYTTFFVFNGLILSLAALGTGNVSLAQISLIFGIVSAAWVTGFLTPGAPGGVGIREVILISGLELIGFGAASASIAVAYRIMTLSGDALFATIASLIRVAPTSEPTQA